MRTLLSAILLTSTTLGAEWNYLKHGADWTPGECVGPAVTN